MNTLQEEQSDLFHMGHFSPLVQLLDAQKGYCLLKNLCPFTDRQYAVGIILENGMPYMVMETSDECWLKADQADEVLRNALNQPAYNKAISDYINQTFE
jgi:hypothetical protein